MNKRGDLSPKHHDDDDDDGDYGDDGYDDDGDDGDDVDDLEDDDPSTRIERRYGRCNDKHSGHHQQT
jgi:hypothetical protein